MQNNFRVKEKIGLIYLNYYLNCAKFVIIFVILKIFVIKYIIIAFIFIFGFFEFSIFIKFVFWVITIIKFAIVFLIIFKTCLNSYLVLQF